MTRKTRYFIMFALIAMSILMYSLHTSTIATNQKLTRTPESQLGTANEKNMRNASKYSFDWSTPISAPPPPDSVQYDMFDLVAPLNEKDPALWGVDVTYNVLYYLAFTGYWPEDMASKDRKKLCLPYYSGVVVITDEGEPFFSRTDDFWVEGKTLPSSAYHKLSGFIHRLKEDKQKPYTDEELTTLLEQQGYRIIKREYNTGITKSHIAIFDEQLCYPSTREEYNAFFNKNGTFTLPPFRFEPL